MEADFSGYATKAGVKCSDGRTIMPGAFKHQDTMQVPLVWQHAHNDPTNVLGHAILEDRPDGVFAYGFFNRSAAAKAAKEALEHGDIKMMSIWANELMERSARVVHGTIREVSLVISGANPGALIQNINISHADGTVDVDDDEAVIFSGEEIVLAHEDSDAGTGEPAETGADTGGDAEETGDTADANEGTDSGTDDATNDSGSDDETNDATEETTEETSDGEVQHATSEDDESLEDIYNSMTEKQQKLVHFMVEEAANAGASGESLEQDNLDDDTTDTQKGTEMTHNAFDQDGDKGGVALSHADRKGLLADAMKNGSLKDAVESYALQHGIEDIELLFPDAQAVDAVPEWLKRRTEWVAKVLGAARKSPFSRIKTLSADITEDEARAKGYIKGNLKKEEFFSVARRITTPTTVYKKQKLDRDDLVDITDFDVVAWLKSEMRLMLDEEIGRAILIGDGRDPASEDKIPETSIRPISKDHELFTTVVNVNLNDASSSVTEMVDAIILNRHRYKGTGLPTMFTTETVIARFLLLKDTLGRRIYKTLDEVANELRVAEIVPVEVMEEEPDILAILVNMDDYVLGATAGGQVSMFDDFDIDYNQHKYLIETRLCGALTKLKSAIVVMGHASDDELVAPAAPTFEDGEITITDTTGVVYKNSAGTTVNNTGSPYAVAEGESETITATPAAGYYFATSDDDTWTFTNDGS